MGRRLFATALQIPFVLSLLLILLFMGWQRLVVAGADCSDITIPQGE